MAFDQDTEGYTEVNPWRKTQRETGPVDIHSVDLKTKTSKLEESNSLLQKENKCLQEEIFNINSELNQQSIAINNQEQYSRRDCIKIRGFPTAPSEDTVQIVKSVGKLVDVEIEKLDISVSPRWSVKSKQGNMPTPAIIVKFVKRDTSYKV